MTSFSISDQALINIEKKVFEKNTSQYVQGFLNDSTEESLRFQNALACYRLGNLLTNEGYTRKSLDGFHSLLLIQTNVFYLSYLALAYGSQAQFHNQLKAMKTSLNLLDRAVELYPDHYMPRFYRGMMLLFIPGIAGGNKKQGQIDMEIVLAQINTIPRNDDYKAMVYFMYGAYWGHRKKYDEALSYVAKARTKARDEKLIKALDEKESEWRSLLK